MKLSIVISTKNQKKLLLNLLNDIANQTEPAKEIIIVDAHSTDGSKEEISPTYHQHIYEAHEPSANLFNVGAKQAKFPWILFLTPDIRISSTYIADLSQTVTKSRASLFFFRTIPKTQSIFLKIPYQISNLLSFLFQEVCQFGKITPLLVKKDVYESVGGFNPDKTWSTAYFVRQSRKYCRIRYIWSLPVQGSSISYQSEKVSKIFFLSVCAHVLPICRIYTLPIWIARGKTW